MLSILPPLIVYMAHEKNMTRKFKFEETAKRFDRVVYALNLEKV